MSIVAHALAECLALSSAAVRSCAFLVVASRRCDRPASALPRRGRRSGRLSHAVNNVAKDDPRTQDHDARSQRQDIALPRTSPSRLSAHAARPCPRSVPSIRTPSSVFSSPLPRRQRRGSDNHDTCSTQTPPRSDPEDALLAALCALLPRQHGTRSVDSDTTHIASPASLAGVATARTIGPPRVRCPRARSSLVPPPERFFRCSTRKVQMFIHGHSARHLRYGRVEVFEDSSPANISADLGSSNARRRPASMRRPASTGRPGSSSRSCSLVLLDAEYIRPALALRWLILTLPAVLVLLVLAPIQAAAVRNPVRRSGGRARCSPHRSHAVDNVAARATTPAAPRHRLALEVELLAAHRSIAVQPPRHRRRAICVATLRLPPLSERVRDRSKVVSNSGRVEPPSRRLLAASFAALALLVLVPICDLQWPSTAHVYEMFGYDQVRRGATRLRSCECLVSGYTQTLAGLVLTFLAPLSDLLHRLTSLLGSCSSSPRTSPSPASPSRFYRRGCPLRTWLHTLLVRALALLRRRRSAPTRPLYGSHEDVQL
ncbi:hypothetical protein B0H15DRAFT_956024 [Mycena belliarum]|uniref:Uncharacterized protein n=1 Tax=Mycena belliarum TaxID=1033014 RepID=A0AAD6TQ31_9AGAR|nr:hypothetical protein B0H15DRAFT_956024 [Mycena belliae]